MSNPNTIARPEIAQLMGISKSALAKVLINPTAKAPNPLLMSGHHFVYDRKKMLAWIATKPLSRVKWRQTAKKAPVVRHTAELTLAFLSGNIGVSTAQRKRQQLLKIVAKHAPRPTQRVEIRGGAYDVGNDGRSNRKLRQAQ